MLQELASFLKCDYTVYMPKVKEVLYDWTEIIGHILLKILHTHIRTHTHRLPDILIKAFMV